MIFLETHILKNTMSFSVLTVETHTKKKDVFRMLGIYIFFDYIYISLLAAVLLDCWPSDRYVCVCVCVF